ncbi:MAG: hypothetical protein AAF581_02005 [Planctomycetota bacterium]
MLAFHLCFPLFMELFPVLFALTTPTRIDAARDEDEVLQRVGVLQTRLLVATVVAVAVTVALWVGGMTRVAGFTWPLFFPLFFGFARPLMIAKNPAWGSNARHDSRRSASFEHRDPQRIVPASAWLPLHLVNAVMAGVLVWQWQELVTNFGVSHAIVGVMIWAVAAGFCIVVGMFAVDATAREPEPRPDEPNPQIEELYVKNRRFRAWTFFGGTVLTSLLLHSCATLIVWGPSGAVVWIGSIGGATLGVVGGIVGVICDLRRVKIQELVRSVSLAKDDDVR